MPIGAAGYLVYPLRNPDPDGVFHDQPRLPHRDEPAPNIHALVATACWIATVIIGLRANQTVAAKSASRRLAAQPLGAVIYRDDETLMTLRTLARDTDHDVRQAAATAVDRVREARSRRRGAAREVFSCSAMVFHPVDRGALAHAQ